MSDPGPFQSRGVPSLWEEVWGTGLSSGLILIGSKMKEAKAETADSNPGFVTHWLHDLGRVT